MALNDKLTQRREVYDALFRQNYVMRAVLNAHCIGHISCPCCGYPTLCERNGYDMCRLCWWEDDGQDDSDADDVRGGPNAEYSLTQARNNFKTHLTMYDPNDNPAFASTTRGRQIKVDIMDGYDALLKSQNEADAVTIYANILELLKQLKKAQATT